MRTMAIVVALAVMACGRPHWDGDPEIYGVLVVDESSARVTEAPDFRDRFRRVIQISIDYIGMPAENLDGWRVVFTDHVECNGEATDGCCVWDDATIWIDISRVECPELGVISHEILHVAIGDPSHSDPRWSGAYLDPLYDRLLGGHVGCREPWGHG